MLQDFNLERITEPLLKWFRQNARVLPWREDVTPYRVWISEIMLQQTRVEAVKPYFERFLAELPGIAQLAECSEDRLLKLWEGLGYYNRVRNLQIAAREIQERFGGQMPADYDKLLSLKGIGPYTAGAVSSIAFGIPMPAVDGNVLRVIMRVTGDDADIAKASTRTAVESALQAIIPATQASAFNQALMELGATVCVPNGAPICSSCPWQEFCEARIRKITDQLPVKKKAKARRIEKRTVLIIQDDDHIVLNKRPNRGLLAGLYEFPNVTGHLTQDEALMAVSTMGLHPLFIKPLEHAKHIFSHVEWHMIAYQIRVDSLTREEAGLLFVSRTAAREDYPIPSAFSAYTTYM